MRDNCVVFKIQLFTVSKAGFRCATNIRVVMQMLENDCFELMLLVMVQQVLRVFIVCENYKGTGEIFLPNFAGKKTKRRYITSNLNML